MRINLLPWREAKQTKSLIWFYLLIIITILVIFISSIIISNKIKHEIVGNNLRHELLMTKIDVIPQLQPLGKLRKEYKQLRATTKFINQQNRHQQNLLSLLKNMGGLMPDTMRATNIYYKSDVVNISGIASHTKDVEMFLKRLRRFKFIKSVRLNDVNSVKDLKNVGVRFKLIVKFVITKHAGAMDPSTRITRSG